MSTPPRLATMADLEDVLARVTDYEKETGYRYSGGTFDLARMRALLERLGHPERAFAAIHVAGTKGKGSTAATAAALLRATGASPVGLYSSPHLVDLRERIRLQGRTADAEDWLQAANSVVPHALALAAGGAAPPTFFEITTAIAFEAFRQQGCEAAAIEVGLGGRLDATNVLSPERVGATVVTEIGFDHTALLGKTLDLIAREKAAIAQPGVPMVVGAREREALAAIEAVARERGASVVEVLGRELKLEVEHVSLDGTRFSLETPRARYRSLETPLIGRHQAENAALAIAAVEHAWAGPLAAPGMTTSQLEDDVRRGLPHVRWRGRFDVVRRPGQPWVVCDGAHDPTSCRRLLETFREVLPGVRPVLLFAVARDKEVERILDALAERGRSGEARDERDRPGSIGALPSSERLIARAFTVRAKTKRAEDPETLARQLIARGMAAQGCDGTSSEALARALEAAAPDGVVLATGSLYLVGEVLTALRETAI